jgi:flagellar P-ring protein precursor FlgI
MTKTLEQLLSTAAIVLAAWAVMASAANAQSPRTPLKSICRLKGQEENRLQGMGLVVGLKGTGDGGASPMTARALAQFMQRNGGQLGKAGLAELKDAKNVALVTVTATLPATGVREGNKVDCQVASAYGAKSLVGGILLITPLLGPDPQSQQVFAQAAGPIELENQLVSTAGRISDGCMFLVNHSAPFTKNGKITLVIDKGNADFQTTAEIANAINRGQVGFQSSSIPLARAIDQINVEVLIPPQYAKDEVEFISQVLAIEVPGTSVGPRVVVNKRTGVIVLGDDVRIAPSVVNHRNVVVQTGGNLPAGRFVGVDPSNSSPTLKSLVEALNAVQVPTEDIIEVIRALHADGRLRAQLVIE